MEIIKISQSQIGDCAVNAVDTRELYKALGLGDGQYSRWIKTYLIDSPIFKENTDFVGVRQSVEGNQITTYMASLDTAKHLCMLARTQKAHQIREYFIECEKKLSQNSTQYKIPQTYAEALLEAGRLALENEKLIAKAKEDAPKVQCFNELMNSKNAIDFMEFSKIIGIGRTKLFAKCRELGVLMQSNRPYQNFIDNGYFRVIESTYTQGDTTRSYTKTMILPKGQAYLTKKLKGVG